MAPHYDLHPEKVTLSISGSRSEMESVTFSGSVTDSFGTLGVWGFAPAHDSLPRALALARRAVELDPLLGDGHASTGLLHMFYDWDWAAAERESSRAIELNPGSALTHLWAGHYLSAVGRFDEAVAAVLHAQALDPVSPITSANVGWTCYLAGRQDRAIDTLESVVERFPDNPMVLLCLGLAYAEVGRFSDAARRLAAASRERGGVPWAAESLGMVHARMGNRELATRLLETSLARMQRAYVPSSAIACIHLGLGDDEALFEWLERCVEERDVLLPWLGVMPAFDGVRPDPRFQAVLAKIGLA
jgi:Flp pilus assembly protein TadD